VPRVSSLSIAPVKGLGLVHPTEVLVGPHGVEDNRRFCLVDESGRRYGALRDPRLVVIGVVWDPERAWLGLTFPDGAVAEGAISLGDEIETDLHERRLVGRLVDGPFSGALSRFAGRPLRLIEAHAATRSIDREQGPISVVSEESLRELARQAEVGEVDRRRFRMLVHVSGCRPHEEDEWIGGEVRLGEARVRPLEPVARCAITTTSPETGARDLDTLRTIAGYRGLRNGKHADFGIFGEVVQPGRVRVGDPVEPL
jgi:MOSC domain-containing protein